MATAELVSPTGDPPSALQGLARLTPVRQIALLAGLALSVALGVAIALWARTPNYALLYSSLSGKEANEVMSALQAENIPFRVEESSGAVMVPSAQLRTARVRLAGLGLPRGTALGFEILDKKQSFGTSEFIERARYQRALEIELARSITELNNVRNARVHLAIPRQSSFVRKHARATASVLVQPFAGRELERGQAKTIAHMVAAAVPRMEPGAVRVVDDRGRLLSGADADTELGISERELEYTRRLESTFVDRIESILDPLIGRGSYRAQVALKIDFTRSEETRELYEPDSTAIRSEQLVEERADPNVAVGVPGALSNQPPAASSTPEQRGDAEPGGQVTTAGKTDEGSVGRETGSIRKRQTRNFELDRSVSHIRSQFGTLKRLSAAVVIDDRVVAGEAGESTRESRTPEEIAQITSLVKEAVAFDDRRGDSVVVVNAPFTEAVPIEPLPAVPVWKQPWVWDAARLAGGGLLVLILLMGVMRPVMRNLVARETLERSIAYQGELAALEAMPETQPVAAMHAPAAGQEMLGVLPSNGGIDSVRTLVAEDPKRVASVVRNWVHENE